MAMIGALKKAVLSHIRIPVSQNALSLCGSNKFIITRAFPSHDDHLTKDQVTDRVLSVIKDFPKVDPSKITISGVATARRAFFLLTAIPLLIFMSKGSLFSTSTSDFPIKFIHKIGWWNLPFFSKWNTLEVRNLWIKIIGFCPESGVSLDCPSIDYNLNLSYNVVAVSFDIN